MHTIEGFESIRGQQKPLALLQQAVRQQQISHAYLFTGPPGVGKNTAAHYFAHCILKLGDPSGGGLFESGAHPDFFNISVPEDRTRISIEQINRELRDWLAYKPYRSRHKVAVIGESHLMTLEAANALLKTLEEPPAYAVLILLADEDIQLQTIVSRCQQIRFQALSADDIAALLVAGGIEEHQALQAAIIAQGNSGLARRLAEEDLGALHETAGGYLTALSSGRKTAIFELADSLEQEGPVLLSLLKLMLRDIFIFQQTGRMELLCLAANESLARQVTLPRMHDFPGFWEKSSRLGGYLGERFNASLVSLNLAWELARLLV